MTQISNKKICITGASSGIGKAMAMAAAAKGAALVLCARSTDSLEQVSRDCLERGAAAVDVQPADLSKKQGRRDVIEAAGTDTDVLILNAGISQRSMAVDTDMDVCRSIMELNFFSSVTLCKGIIPGMLERGKGHIVVISSIAGKFGTPWRSSYSASKHALQGYFESLRAELEDEGISVTIVNPGRINTNISINALEGSGKRHGQKDAGQAQGLSAGYCARKIIKAIEHNKRELNIGGKEMFVLYLRRFFPAVYYRLIKKVETR